MGCLVKKTYHLQCLAQTLVAGELQPHEHDVLVAAAIDSEVAEKRSSKEVGLIALVGGGIAIDAVASAERLPVKAARPAVVVLSGVADSEVVEGLTGVADQVGYAVVPTVAAVAFG